MKQFALFYRFVSIFVGMAFLSSISMADPTWTRVNYTSSTAFIGEVKINDYDDNFPITIEAGDYIGAFVGDECRMIAEVFEYDGKLYVSSVIQGGDVSDMTGLTSEPEEVEFKVWDNSSDMEVSYTVYGTMDTEPAGEIFDYEIGNPNTNSSLESLSVSGYTLSPVFSASTTSYEFTVPYGTILPASSAYVADAEDSRATVSVSAATEFDTDGKASTQIIVTAENGTTTTYAVTIIQEECSAEAPQIASVEYCWGAADYTLNAEYDTETETAVWYSVAEGGSPLASGNGFTSPETNVGAYTYYVATDNGVCESTERTAVMLTINPLPAVTLDGLEDTYCSQDDPVALSVVTDAQAYVVSYFVNGESVDEFDPSTAQVGDNTIVYNLIDENGCKTSSETSVTVIANPTIDLSANPSMTCVGTSIDLTPTNGTWSGDGVSGTTFSRNIAGSVTLHYEEESQGCSSSADIAISVYQADCPVVSSASVEIGGEVPSLTATADGTVYWYLTEEGGSSIYRGSSFTPDVSTASEAVYTYYVSNVLESGCQSELVPVTLSVTSCLTEAPVLTEVDAICEGDEFPVLTATGTNITWYNAVTGGDALATGSTYQPTSAGIYYASQNPGCEGVRASVTVTVKDVPSSPILTAGSSCSGETIEALTSDVAADWYLDKNGSPVAENVTSYTPSIVATTTFYARRIVDGCSSDFAEVVYSIGELPPAPVTSNTEACLGSEADYYVRMSGSLEEGATLQWYDENGASLGTEKIQDVVVTSAKDYTYTVTQTVGGCESPSATAILTVHALLEPSLDVEASYCSSSNETITLSSDIPDGYFTIDGLIKDSFVPSELEEGSHEAAYTVEDEHGCYGESKATFIIEDCSAPDVTSITLSETTLELIVDKSSSLTASASPETSPQTVTWASSDKTVAVVDANGLVTAIAPGTAVITATSTYTLTVSATCQVTVVAPAVESISLSQSSLQLVEGENSSMAVTVLPAKADQTIVWSSSDETVATVDASGIVTAVGSGNAIITAQSESNPAITATCQVTVESQDVPVTGITVSQSTLNIIKGETATLTASVEPMSAEQTVTWSSSDETVATIDENGVVTAVAAGDAVITVVSTADKTITSTCAVSVISPITSVAFNNTEDLTIGENSTIDLSTYLVVQPSDASISSVVWTTTSASATISDGVLTSKSVDNDTPVTVTVTVSTKDGSSQKETVTVTIIKGCTLSAPVVSESSQSICAGSTEGVTFTATGDASASWVWIDASSTAMSSTNTFTTADPGTYYVYQKSGSCVSSQTAVVLTEKEKPAAPVVADVSVCEGETGTFVANVSSRWYTSAGDFLSEGVTYAPTESGTYIVRTTIDGCESDALQVQYMIHSLPSVSINPVSELTVDDAPVTITVSPTGGVLSGTGVTGTQFDPSVGEGSYTISYTYEDVNKCSNTATTEIIVSESQVEVADRTALGNAISRANTVVSLYADDETFTDAAKYTLSQAIDVAQAYYDSYTSYTTEKLDAQAEILNQAVQDFLDSQIQGIDLTELQAKILEAVSVLADNEYRKGTSVGYIPETSFDMLQSAINVANGVVNNPPDNQAAVTRSVTVLSNAIAAFLASEIPNTVTSISFDTTKIYMIVGEEYTPVLQYNPNGAFSDIIWETSNEDVAWIYGSGKIIAKQTGSVAITATAVNNPEATARLIVQVTETPVLQSVTLNRLGNQLYLEFTEDMAEPSAEVYTDLCIYGVTIPMYVIQDVSLWPLNPKRVVVTLGSGTYIDNTNDIEVVYKGLSLTSIYGAEVPNFEYRFADTPVEDVLVSSLTVYPTVAQAKVTISGITEGSQIKIVSATGKTINTHVADSEAEEIDITSYKAGMYYVLVYADGIIIGKSAFMKK